MRGGGGDEAAAKSGVGGAAGVERRVGDDGVERRVGVEPRRIGPVELRARIGDIAARAVKRGMLGLDQVQFRRPRRAAGSARDR